MQAILDILDQTPVFRIVASFPKTWTLVGGPETIFRKTQYTEDIDVLCDVQFALTTTTGEIENSDGKGILSLLASNVAKIVADLKVGKADTSLE
jgi:hypothetical protein